MYSVELSSMNTPATAELVSNSLLWYLFLVALATWILYLVVRATKQDIPDDSLSPRISKKDLLEKLKQGMKRGKIIRKDSAVWFVVYGTHIKIGYRWGKRYASAQVELTSVYKIKMRAQFKLGALFLIAVVGNTPSEISHNTEEDMLRHIGY